MERVSVARMGTAKPQGWVDAALGMGGPSPVPQQLNNYFSSLDFKQSRISASLTQTGDNTCAAATSTSGPMTAVKATPELRPNTATATAMASSKLLPAAVKATVAVFE